MPGPNEPRDFQRRPGFNPSVGQDLLNAELLAQQQQALQTAAVQATAAQAAAVEAATLAAATPTPTSTLTALTALQAVVAAHTTQLAAHQATLNLITAALTKPAT